MFITEINTKVVVATAQFLVFLVIGGGMGRSFYPFP